MGVWQAFWGRDPFAGWSGKDGERTWQQVPVLGKMVACQAQEARRGRWGVVPIR